MQKYSKGNTLLNYFSTSALKQFGAQNPIILFG